MVFEKRYVIWNPTLVARHTQLDADSLIGLADAEDRTCGSVSSVIKTSDIKKLIESVFNETNIKLCYALHKAYREACRQQDFPEMANNKQVDKRLPENGAELKHQLQKSGAY